MAKRLPSFIVLLIIIISINCHAQSENKEYKVLYLNSYNIGYSWTDNITKGIRQVLDSAKNINYYAEFMDGKRFRSSEYLESFYKHITTKYKNESFDLILAADNLAVDFYFYFIDSKIFKEVPLIFCGIANIDDYPFKSINAKGVVEFRNASTIFYTMGSLFPEKDTIYTFLDDTPTSYTYRNIISKFEEEYMRPKFKILNFYSNDSVAKVISSLSDNCMVYLFNLNYSPKNTYVPYELYLKNLQRPNQIPIFANQFDDIKGIVGGEYNSGKIHGITAAKLAYKTLYNIPIKESIVYPDPTLQFNDKELKRFNLKPKFLPRNSVIVNKDIPWIKKAIDFITFSDLFNIMVILILISVILYNRKIRKYKDKLEETRDKAVQSELVKSAFIANISHEIRTPLNAIIGFSDILLIENENDLLEEYIKHINESSKLLENLVNDVLDLSLIDSNEVHLNNSEIFLPEYLESLVARNRVHIDRDKKPKLTIKLKKPDQGPQFIYADKLRLNQILQNIISNSIKYSFSGTITVTYELIDQKEAIEKSGKDENVLMHDIYCLFSVKDHGIGIPQELKSFVFERFRRIDQLYQGHHGGIGLGLNIAKSIVEIMGGSIWFESTENKGSTFYFFIPFVIKKE